MIVTSSTSQRQIKEYWALWLLQLTGQKTASCILEFRSVGFSKRCALLGSRLNFGSR